MLEYLEIALLKNFKHARGGPPICMVFHMALLFLLGRNYRWAIPHVLWFIFFFKLLFYFFCLLFYYFLFYLFTYFFLSFYWCGSQVHTLNSNFFIYPTWHKLQIYNFISAICIKINKLRYTAEILIAE